MLLGQTEPRQYSPGTLGSVRAGVSPCGSVAPAPASLPRLLWLPERWLGGRAGPILGDSMLPPARRPCVNEKSKRLAKSFLELWVVNMDCLLSGLHPHTCLL